MDFKLTENGDLQLKTGDVLFVSDKEYYMQCAISRLKSVKKDWFMDNIGADMEELLGLPNSKDVGEMGKAKIMTSMTEDNLFSNSEIEVTIYPVNKSTIAYYVAFDKQSIGKFSLNASLDLVKGITVMEV